MNPFSSCIPADDGQSLRCEVWWSEPGLAGVILHVSISIPRVDGESQQQTDARAIAAAKLTASRFAGSL